jgi:hypothetical protein
VALLLLLLCREGCCRHPPACRRHLLLSCQGQRRLLVLPVLLWRPRRCQQPQSWCPRQQQQRQRQQQQQQAGVACPAASQPTA